MNPAHLATWLIAGVSVLGVVLRPWRLPEALWAVGGAMALLILSLLPIGDGWRAVVKGGDVYAFLIGMMLLAELARHEGMFDWLAAHAVRLAAGSPGRLFLLIYIVGTLVTIFLSNDATAVVLTPAVYAAAKQARATPLPYLFICAFVANAASFVLPISNPANLVVYGSHMPPLSRWLAHFGVASVIAIVMTYALLRFTQRGALQGSIHRGKTVPPLGSGGRLVGGAIALTAALLLVASAKDWQLGLPTLVAGVLATVAIVARRPATLSPILRELSWGVLPLVAGLFVLVDGVEKTGALQPLTEWLAVGAQSAPRLSALAAGCVAAVACNLMNNLPLGLAAGSVAAGAHLPSATLGPLLIGVDLGPNLSVTGSLATILWLVALRREGETISAWRFLAVGAVVMPPTLIATLAALIVG